MKWARCRKYSTINVSKFLPASNCSRRLLGIRSHYITSLSLLLFSWYICQCLKRARGRKYSTINVSKFLPASNCSKKTFRNQIIPILAFAFQSFSAISQNLTSIPIPKVQYISISILLYKYNVTCNFFTKFVILLFFLQPPPVFLMSTSIMWRAEFQLRKILFFWARFRTSHEGFGTKSYILAFFWP